MLASSDALDGLVREHVQVQVRERPPHFDALLVAVGPEPFEQKDAEDVAVLRHIAARPAPIPADRLLNPMHAPPVRLGLDQIGSGLLRSFHRRL